MEMDRRLILALSLVISLTVPLIATDGTFEGRVVEPPRNQPQVRGWIYVQGRNHMLRRVDVLHAQIIVRGEVAVGRKHKCNLDCLSAGQEIRVTAELDHDGEWRAKRVEIIKLITHHI